MRADSKTVLGQGVGQAIKDGAALGVLFDQVHGEGIIEDRLQLFKQVRRNRASILQMLSNASPSIPQNVRDAAAQCLPDGKRLDTANDIDEYLFSFDVIEESQAALAAKRNAHRIP